MKACDIFKTNREYKIITFSLTDIDLLISDNDCPVFILPIETCIKDIKKAIFESLNNSRKNIYMPKPEEWTKWQKEGLKKIKEKSFTELYKKSNYVGLRLDKNVLRISPGRYNPAHKSISIIEEDVLEIKYSPDKEMAITEEIVNILKINYNAPK